LISVGVEVVMELAGVVEGKRKRADGSIHLALLPMKMNNTVTGNLISETSRTIQLIYSPTITKTIPEMPYDVMSLISSGSTIQAIGSLQLETDPTTQGGRQRYLLTALKLIRIGSFPEHISRVVSYVQDKDFSLHHHTLYRYFNSVISPKPIVPSDLPSLLNPTDGAATEAFTLPSSGVDHRDYLATLIQNNSAVKTHCHLMTTYLTGNRGSLKGVNLEVLDGVVTASPDEGAPGLVDYELIKRPPRRRNRKISLYEKSLIDLYESVTFPHLFRHRHQQTTATTLLPLLSSPPLNELTVSIDITSCRDDLSPTIDLSEGLTEDEQIVNLPDGDVSAPSARGQSTRGEYLHGKKHPQILWMTRRLLEMMRSANGSFVHLIDIGGGRGDLAVHLASALEREYPSLYHITVLDLNEKSLIAGRDYARSRQLSDHISFLHLDFREFVLQSPLSTSLLRQSVDHSMTTFLIIGLHICGDLTDLAMEYSRTLSSSSSSCSCSCCGFLLVPCCYSKCCLDRNGHQEDDLTVSEEWRGWVHESQTVLLIAQEQQIALVGDVPSSSLTRDMFPITPQRHTVMRRALCTLAESNPREYQWRAMMIINALRLSYLSRTLRVGTKPDDDCTTSSLSSRGQQWRLSLESFPHQYSLRNIVICGQSV
jgi:hypothetical protein